MSERETIYLTTEEIDNGPQAPGAILLAALVKSGPINVTEELERDIEATKVLKITPVIEDEHGEMVAFEIAAVDRSEVPS